MSQKFLSEKFETERKINKLITDNQKILQENKQLNGQLNSLRHQLEENQDKKIGWLNTIDPPIHD